MRTSGDRRIFAGGAEHPVVESSLLVIMTYSIALKSDAAGLFAYFALQPQVIPLRRDAFHKAETAAIFKL